MEEAAKNAVETAARTLRDRLPKGQTKGSIVPIRFTKAEAEQLAKAAKSNDQTLSEWIRQAVLAAISP